MDLQPLLERFSEQQVAAFMLVLARLSPLFLLAPLFSSRSLPARAKGVLAVGLAANAPRSPVRRPRPRR